MTSPAYNVEMTLVASSAARESIETSGQPNPNLSAAVRAGYALFVSGMLAEGEALTGDGAIQTRDILRKLDIVLTRAGFSRADVRELLVYVTDAEAGPPSVAECRAGFGAKVAITPVKADLAVAGGRVEIMACVERA